ncbi:succinylglutamate desuccinylase/aspartoacylase domain-containing protein [Aureimonas altamirensis]|uniref:succinylglutamate desuccinylase/aspartoacylase domain-containing protein n=1 Tax=Aureimonas altamirensis TaxID=370622 RepID=UPI00068E85BD|nr:succinylglutamate desuccinylase/aspartoacylase family protein [Aureimonas altamirensis]
MDTIRTSGTALSTRDLRDVIAEGNGYLPEQMTVIDNGKGPTILVCGGIHGDEYEPQVVLRRLAREVDPATVTGRLIIIPSINFPGSQRGSRVSTIDNANMNRTFPGEANGTATQRLSRFLADEVFPQCDLLIDLHTGGAEYTVVPLIFGFTNPQCAVTEDRLESLMQSWGARFIQYVEGVPSTAVGCALAQNLASVETEGGSGGALDTAELDTLHEALMRGLANIGVIGSNVTPSTVEPIRVRVGKDNQYTAPRDGIVQHRVTLGEFVRKGALLAILHPVSDGDGEALQIRSSVDGYVLRLNANAFVRAGALIGNTGSAID